MLSSKLLSDNQRLKDCEVSDPAHVTPGSRGEHVQLIQTALFLIERADIDESEVDAGFYGSTTTQAVLAYKTAREIINFSYQRTADNVVGKMTIKRLDEDMLAVEAQGPRPFAGHSLRPFVGRMT